MYENPIESFVIIRINFKDKIFRIKNIYTHRNNLFLLSVQNGNKCDFNVY